MTATHLSLGSSENRNDITDDRFPLMNAITSVSSGSFFPTIADIDRYGSSHIRNMDTLQTYDGFAEETGSDQLSPSRHGLTVFEYAELPWILNVLSR